MAAAIFGFSAFAVEKRIERSGHFEKTVTIEPGSEVAYIVVSAMRGTYSFQVKPFDGPVLMAAGQIDEGDNEQIQPGDVQKVVASAATVEPGPGRKTSVDLDRGRFLWVVANPSKDHPVQVYISFHP